MGLCTRLDVPFKVARRRLINKGMFLESRVMPWGNSDFHQGCTSQYTGIVYTRITRRDATASHWPSGYRSIDYLQINGARAVIPSILQATDYSICVPQATSLKIIEVNTWYDKVDMELNREEVWKQCRLGKVYVYLGAWYKLGEVRWNGNNTTNFGNAGPNDWMKVRSVKWLNWLPLSKSWHSVKTRVNSWPERDRYLGRRCAGNTMRVVSWPEKGKWENF